MEQNYWTVIDTLADCVVSGHIDHGKFQEARLRISLALDQRVINKLPVDELERLRGVLDTLEYDEQGKGL